MLRIQCPSCDASFQAGEEFLGKYVECGSCEQKFTVTEENLSDTPRKLHSPAPGERNKSGLDVFNKTFESVGGSNQIQKSKQYKYVAHDDFMPPPIWKKATLWLGIVLLTFGVLALIMGSLKNGFLTDADLDKRFIIAGFVTIVTAVCFLLSDKHLKNALLKVTLSALLLCSLAYFLPRHETLTMRDNLTDPLATEITIQPEEAVPEIITNYPSFAELSAKCHYEPVTEGKQKNLEMLMPLQYLQFGSREIFLFTNMLFRIISKTPLS